MHYHDLYFFKIYFQHAALSRRLREVMMEYNQVEQDYSDKLKDNVRRKLKIGMCVNLEMTTVCSFTIFFFHLSG